MTINRFLKIIPKIKDFVSDPSISHLKMAPPYRKYLLDLSKKKYNNSKKAGVSVLFHPINNNIFFTLILRNEYDGVHSKQISFPGGRTEKNDKNIYETALRETNEEIGVNVDEIKLIRKLENLYIPPSNYDITPFMVFASKKLDFYKDKNEVQEIINIDLDQLLDMENVVNTKGSHISNRYLDTLVPAYKFNNHFVWGATAMILSEVKDIINSVI